MTTCTLKTTEWTKGFRNKKNNFTHKYQSPPKKYVRKTANGLSRRIITCFPFYGNDARKLIYGFLRLLLSCAYLLTKKSELSCSFYGEKKASRSQDCKKKNKKKNNLQSNVLSVRNCNDVQLAHFSASTSNLLMQTISLPLGSLLAMVLGHIILYENGGWQALAVRQTSAACCLSLQLFWKSAWISFGL